MPILSALLPLIAPRSRSPVLSLGAHPTCWKAVRLRKPIFQSQVEARASAAPLSAGRSSAGRLAAGHQSGGGAQVILQGTRSTETQCKTPKLQADAPCTARCIRSAQAQPPSACT